MHGDDALVSHAGSTDELRRRLDGILAELVSIAGITGGHLLQTQTPKVTATREQKIRGGVDPAADWILLVNGYDAKTVSEVHSARFNPAALNAMGAEPGYLTSFYNLSFALTPNDLRQ